jgi:hypothetical protein
MKTKKECARMKKKFPDGEVKEKPCCDFGCFRLTLVDKQSIYHNIECPVSTVSIEMNKEKDCVTIKAKNSEKPRSRSARFAHVKFCEICKKDTVWYRKICGDCDKK